MKVLMTATRCYRGYHSSADSLRASDTGIAAVLDAFEDAGIEYEIRPVDPGECLDEYDCCMVTLTNALVQGNNDLYGALWTVSQDWTGGPPVVVNFDHWTLRDNIKSYVRLHVQPEKLFDGFIEYKKRDRAKKYASTFADQLEMIASGQWPATMTCAWDWGYHDMLDKGLEGLHSGFDLLYDPSYLHVDLCKRVQYRMQHDDSLVPPRYGRERKWVLGSISQHERWIEKQELTWACEFYGLPKKGWPFVSRDTLLARYTQVWGALSPPYYHIGSGYWRARLVHYAMAGCITLADPAELGPLGDPYKVSARQIESMTEPELQQLARDQHEIFMLGIEPADAVRERIVGFFEGLSKRGPVQMTAFRPEFTAPDPLQERLL